MKKPKTKHVTIEELAALMQKEFAETRKYTEKYTDKAVGELAIMVAKGFEDTNSRVDDLRNEMGARFVATDKRIDNLGYKIDRLELKVDGLEEKMDRGFESVKGVLKSHAARIARLEE